MMELSTQESSTLLSDVRECCLMMMTRTTRMMSRKRQRSRQRTPASRRCDAGFSCSWRPSRVSRPSPSSGSGPCRPPGTWGPWARRGTCWCGRGASSPHTSWPTCDSARPRGRRNHLHQHQHRNSPLTSIARTFYLWLLFLHTRARQIVCCVVVRDVVVVDFLRRRK